MQRKMILGALALAAALAFTTPASAAPYRGGYGGYRGGYGGYNSYHGGYGGYYGGYGGYAYRPGLNIGIGLGGYGYGGYGNGGYAYGYAPSYGYSASTYVPSTTYIEPGYPNVARAPADSTRESLYYAPEETDNTAHLRILVPANATVWVGGMETTKRGQERDFASPALTPGKAYTYEVKARWMQAGEPVERTRRVRVMANKTTTVDFGKVAEVDR